MQQMDVLPSTNSALQQYQLDIVFANQLMEESVQSISIAIVKSKNPNARGIRADSASVPSTQPAGSPSP